MNIHCGDRTLVTSCRGCLCHDLAMQFGELHNGHCAECGCPKTKAAFDHDYQLVKKEP